MSTPSLTSAIKEESRRLGFDLAGVTPAATPTGFHAFTEWLSHGYAGTMEYLPRRAEAYRHPDAVLGGVRSVVMLAMNYRTAEPPAAVAGTGRVSRYSWSGIDYHDLLRARLKQLLAFIESNSPGANCRGVIDTAPLLERDFARMAGLGWFGKNTMLINKKLGSWFFLAAVLTDLELDVDPPHEIDHCGTCTRCLDACPTDAFPAPGVLDARRCISYQTIEHRGLIPLELRSGMQDWLFGCDICQDVCPWNRKAPVTSVAEFRPLPELQRVELVDLLRLTEAEFKARFRHTPLARPKRVGLLRNACVVLGNSGDQRFVEPLAGALGDEEPVIRGTAAWALGRLGGLPARTALEERQHIEQDPDVLAEVQAALEATVGRAS